MVLWRVIRDVRLKALYNLAQWQRLGVKNTQTNLRLEKATYFNEEMISRQSG